MNFYQKSIRKTISQLYSQKISPNEGFKRLKDLPFLDMGFAKPDMHRVLRKGFPEVIYSDGKSIRHLQKIIGLHLKGDSSVVLTKAKKEVYRCLNVLYPQLKYNSSAGIIYFQKKKPSLKKGIVSVVTAGTSDINVAEEAAVMLEIMGNRVRRIYDVGVAGIHRVLSNSHSLNASRAIIVIAGMEGALASVVGGLVRKPVIAVPTSVGYGASFKGIAPLLTMLNCCAPGVVVVNIDNGFGAAYFADMIR